MSRRPNKSNKPSEGGPTDANQQDEQVNTLLVGTQTDVNSIYRNVLDSIASKFQFSTCPTEAEILSRPMVLMLGNHSSGKSTFINYLLGDYELQITGQAPMDDCFTLLSYGKKNEVDTQDGHALVSNTNLPYAGLNNLGTQFVEHFRMKFVKHRLLQAVTLVDSPGMIDAVGGQGRGYDFVKAVLWFAQRADYILFFFDGEKPGVVGETMDVLTKLGGMDHKLLILMNKVDTFRNISDFVRTYGTLCWNLSKIMNFNKDMPYIYTTYVDTSEAKINNLNPSFKSLPVTLEPDEEPEVEGEGESSSSKKDKKKKKKNKNGDHSDPIDAKQQALLDDPERENMPYRTWSLDEFKKARGMIVSKIQSAPSRHADNMITELKNNTTQLLMHSRVITEARNHLWWARFNAWLLTLTAFFMASLLVFAFAPNTERVVDKLTNHNTVIALVIVFLITALMIIFYVPRYLKNRQHLIVEGLDKIFEHVYNDELTRGSQSEYFQALWTNMEPITKAIIERRGLLQLPALSPIEQVDMEKVISTDVVGLFDVVHKALKRK